MNFRESCLVALIACATLWCMMLDWKHDKDPRFGQTENETREDKQVRAKPEPRKTAVRIVKEIPVVESQPPRTPPNREPVAVQPSEIFPTVARTPKPSPPSPTPPSVSVMEPAVKEAIETPLAASALLPDIGDIALLIGCQANVSHQELTEFLTHSGCELVAVRIVADVVGEAVVREAFVVQRTRQPVRLNNVEWNGFRHRHARHLWVDWNHPAISDLVRNVLDRNGVRGDDFSIRIVLSEAISADIRHQFETMARILDVDPVGIHSARVQIQRGASGLSPHLKEILTKSKSELSPRPKSQSET